MQAPSATRAMTKLNVFVKCSLVLGLASILSTNAHAFDEIVDNSQPISAQRADAKVEELLANSKIVRKEHFCVKGELTCRTHYTLADAQGNVLRAFYVRFVAVDRSVGGNGYFFSINKSTDEFIRMEDFTYDGKVNVNSVEQVNVVHVKKTKFGSVKAIRGVLVPKLGTTKTTNADIVVSARATVLAGVTTDSADPAFSQPSRTVYLRTHVTK